MAEFHDRELHLVKKALTIAVLAIDRQPGPFQSASDQADMRDLLDRLIVNDTELAFYARSAQIAVTGEADAGSDRPEHGLPTGSDAFSSAFLDAGAAAYIASPDHPEGADLPLCVHLLFHALLVQRLAVKDAFEMARG